MMIPLGNEVRAEVIDSVLGQLSDGIWENSGGMDKYWKFADVYGANLEISEEPFDDEQGWGRHGSTIRRVSNGFYGKSEKQIKDWFANKAKQVVKIWAEDYGKDPKVVWDRSNSGDVVDYMGGHAVPKITVADVYECYDFLKGRSGKKYGSVPVEEPVEDEPYEVVDDVVEPKTSGGMNPSQQDLEDFFLDASTQVRRNRGYVRASDDILAYGKCIGYGVDYRNMHTAIHGIIVFSDRDDAEWAYDELKRASRADYGHEYDFILDDIFNSSIEVLEEINYRNFTDAAGEKVYPYHDDEFIIIVNNISVDVFV